MWQNDKLQNIIMLVIFQILFCVYNSYSSAERNHSALKHPEDIANSQHSDWVSQITFNEYFKTKKLIKN